MGAARKLSIALTEELAGDVEAAVASGDYSTASEVVRDALRAWKRERGDREAAIRRLKQLWDEGVASGEPVEGGFDAEDIIRRSEDGRRDWPLCSTTRRPCSRARRGWGGWSRI